LILVITYKIANKNTPLESVLSLFQHISGNERKLGVKADVLPRLCAALVLSNPPRSLTQLRLSHVLVEPAVMYNNRKVIYY